MKSASIISAVLASLSFLRGHEAASSPAELAMVGGGQAAALFVRDLAEVIQPTFSNISGRIEQIDEKIGEVVEDWDRYGYAVLPLLDQSLDIPRLNKSLGEKTHKIIQEVSEILSDVSDTNKMIVLLETCGSLRATTKKFEWVSSELRLLGKVLVRLNLTMRPGGDPDVYLKFIQGIQEP